MDGWLVTTTVSPFVCYHGNHYTHIPHTFSDVKLFGMNFIQLFFCDRILQNRELLQPLQQNAKILKLE